MALAPGTKLGTFEILFAIGKGGMGEVYRARDTKLGRETRLLASLNHPNVATVHEFETAVSGADTPLDPPSRGELHFLVMGLVEGDTIEDRIARGPLSVTVT